MRVTGKKQPNLKVANENLRQENFLIDFFFSSILGILVLVILKPNIVWILKVLIFYSVRFIYYFSCELIFQKTPGKLQTQTKVVNEENEKPNVIQSIIRNICRFISFSSFVSDDEIAIHDKISNTYVVKDSSIKKIDFKKPILIIINSLIIIYFLYNIIKNIL